MPLLQGQAFKLIKPLEVYPVDSPIFTIKHTGEEFLNKSDYEDRLALYSQPIWTCQCSGRTGLTHEEAWASETNIRSSARSSVPAALQKPLLTLIHHSLSPLEQLIDAASALIHSQFHTGEELVFVHQKQLKVRVIKSKYASKPQDSVANGVKLDEDPVVNGTVNGVSPDEGSSTSPGKENHTKESHSVKEETIKKEILSKLYDVATVQEQTLIENVAGKNLMRLYKLPSKDQLRLYIRSCALRQRGSTCSPWVVCDELVAKYCLAAKLPNAFVNPQSALPSSSAVRQATATLSPKRKLDFPFSSAAPKRPKSLPSQQPSPSLSNLLTTNSDGSKSVTLWPASNLGSVARSSLGTGKNKLSVGRPRLTPKDTGPKVPRKRGRPPLTAAEKERNRRMRQASLEDISAKMRAHGAKLNLIKPENDSAEERLAPPATLPVEGSSVSGYLSATPQPFGGTSYKSPLKRATTPEALMELPFMRRFLHEFKTVKGVQGQYRRYAHTLDIVLSKLSSTQVQMIPHDGIKNDLLARQKKVQDKKYFEKLTPDERKQYIKDKARTVALERWKERKLKNLKVEDATLDGLLDLPLPTIVKTLDGMPNWLFGDVVMVIDFVHCFTALLFGGADPNRADPPLTAEVVMAAAVAGAEGYGAIAELLCVLLPVLVQDHTMKHCKELGISTCSIPITYQTAPELARLVLKATSAEVTEEASEEGVIDLIGKERNELSDCLMEKLERQELWELSCEEVVAVLKALVHKALCTAAVSVYVDDMEEKVLRALRERRGVARLAARAQKEQLQKRKEDRLQAKRKKGELEAAGIRRKRGRPKGYSPKKGNLANLQSFLKVGGLSSAAQSVQRRRQSLEQSKKEVEESKRTDKEREEEVKSTERVSVACRAYDLIVAAHDLLKRRAPLGCDRNHARYWLFPRTCAPAGLYVETGWPHEATTYFIAGGIPVTPIKLEEIKEESDGTPCSSPSMPTSIAPKEDPDDETPLSQVRSKLTLAPMRLCGRGRPPKEAYVLVDEDTQTFPLVGENRWFRYESMTDVECLMSCLSDRGQRESSLIAAINLNMDKLKAMFEENHKEVDLAAFEGGSNLKASLKEDIVQIERELIEGWLGGVDRFEDWRTRVEEAGDLRTLGSCLIEAQRFVDLKNLGSVMTAAKKEARKEEETQIGEAVNGTAAEAELTEGSGVSLWRNAVFSCGTLSRMHVLVSIFDSCIKWEKSMATRKCKVCRGSGTKTGTNDSDLLLICASCETCYHSRCLRTSLPQHSDAGGDAVWKCPACAPKKARRQEAAVETTMQEECGEDQDEKSDPTFRLYASGAISGRSRRKRSTVGTPGQSGALPRHERECCVCFARVGLIFCAKCDLAYHSECHDPPLSSRARKDWVCGRCESGKAPRPRKQPAPPPSPFANLEAAFASKSRESGATKCSRDTFGRFLKAKQTSLAAQKSEEGDMSGEEMMSEAQGARANLQRQASKPKSNDNRRSGRTSENKKMYKDKSEEEKEEVDVEESGEEELGEYEGEKEISDKEGISYKEEELSDKEEEISDKEEEEISDKEEEEISDKEEELSDKEEELSDKEEGMSDKEEEEITDKEEEEITDKEEEEITDKEEDEMSDKEGPMEDEDQREARSEGESEEDDSGEESADYMPVGLQYGSWCSN